MLTEHRLVFEPKRRAFVAEGDVAFVPPAVLRLPEEDETPESWLEHLSSPKSYVILLVQAGASALGWFEADECIAHKAIKRYVKRGSGRAQPAHLKTKGKSRYGSRLRLQNARRQLDETCAKIQQWYEEMGTPEQVFTSVPIRTWAELAAATPPLPFSRRESSRIQHHVHTPNFEELVRVQNLITHGQVLGT